MKPPQWEKTFTEPQKEHIRLFVRSLRTTKRQQGRGWLVSKALSSTRRQYCCLGIACEVAKKHAKEFQLTNVIVAQGDLLGYQVVKYGLFPNASETMLPDAVQEWYGFDDADPHLYIPKSLRVKHFFKSKEHRSATWLNDSLKFTFTEIADCFEFNFLPDEYRGPAEDLEECRTYDK